MRIIDRLIANGADVSIAESSGLKPCDIEKRKSNPTDFPSLFGKSLGTTIGKNVEILIMFLFQIPIMFSNVIEKTILIMKF